MQQDETIKLSVWLSLCLSATHPRDEVSTASTHVAWESQVDLRDPTIRLMVTFCFKGRLANEELVAQDSKTPQVHLLIVELTLNHLRGEVVEGATQSGSSTTRGAL